MTAATRPIRVYEKVHKEVAAAARLTGRSGAELLSQAWLEFTQGAEFSEELRAAQKAFASGDLEKVADLLITASAREKALRIRRMHEDYDQ